MASNNLKAVKCNLKTTVNTGAKYPSGVIMGVTKSKYFHVGVGRVTATMERSIPVVRIMIGGRMLNVIHR